MYINCVNVDRKIPFGKIQISNTANEPENPIRLALVQRIHFPRSNTDLILTQRSKSQLAPEKDQDLFDHNKVFERSIPRAGFTPHPYRHPYARPKVGPSQVGRNAKHMQFLKTSPSIAELNKKLSKENDRTKEDKVRSRTARSVRETIDKESKIEAMKQQDLFIAYKGNRDLINLVFPSKSESDLRSTSLSPTNTQVSSNTYLSNPLQVLNFQDKGRAKSAVAQETYLLRNRPPLSMLNTNSHVPVPLFIPSTATPRKGTNHNPAAYVPQTMAPYLYGIRGKPVQAGEKHYPNSRNSQTEIGVATNNGTPLPSPTQNRLPQKPPTMDSTSPVVQPTTPLASTRSRLPSARQRPERAQPLTGIVGLPPITTDSRVLQESREELQETKHPTTPRSEYMKQSHVRFQLDDEYSAETTSDTKTSNKAEEIEKKAEETNDITSETKQDEVSSDIDSLDGGEPRYILDPDTSTTKLPVEVYNIQAI